MRTLGKLVVTLVLLMMVVPAFAASFHLDVQPSRGKCDISVGDLFYISYTLTNAEGQPTMPKSVPGAKVMYFDLTGQSSSFTSVNGKTSQSTSYTYTLTLRAEKEGTFSFGPVNVGPLKSNTVSYIIGKASGQTPNMGNSPQTQSANQSGQNPDAPKFIGKGDGNLFLKAEVSKTTAYQQEALVYTVKLYTTYDAIKFIGATAAPKFEGFVVEESKDVSDQLAYETYKGKTYATAIIARYIIFPQMTGKLKVIGNKYTVSVDEREYYHDPFWGNLSMSKPLQLNVTPNDLTVDVKGLPVPQPADFSGGVGSFSITSSLPESKLTSNQAASIIYTVTGTGNLKYVKLPDLNSLYPPQLEVYSPTPDVSAKVGKTNVSGNARFDYSFMPLEPGSYTIPDVKLVYFNPETGKYETSVANGYVVNVDQGKGSVKSQTKGNLSFDNNLLEIGKLKRRHSPLVYGFPYWLAFILPVLMLVFAAIYYRQYLKANADILVVKSRKANRMARIKLKKANACMKKRDYDAFYDEMLATVWGYLGDKMKMPTSELTRENVSGKLEANGVGKEETEKVIALLDECEFAKYAPGSVKENMTPVYEEGAEIINALEAAFKTKLK